LSREGGREGGREENDRSVGGQVKAGELRERKRGGRKQANALKAPTEGKFKEDLLVLRKHPRLPLRGERVKKQEQQQQHHPTPGPALVLHLSEGVDS